MPFVKKTPAIVKRGGREILDFSHMPPHYHVDQVALAKRVLSGLDDGRYQIREGFHPGRVRERFTMADKGDYRVAEAIDHRLTQESRKRILHTLRQTAHRRTKSTVDIDRTVIKRLKGYATAKELTLSEAIQSLLDQFANA